MLQLSWVVVRTEWAPALFFFPLALLGATGGTGDFALFLSPVLRKEQENCHLLATCCRSDPALAIGELAPATFQNRLLELRGQHRL